MAQTPSTGTRRPITLANDCHRARRPRSRARARPVGTRNICLITAWRICKLSRLEGAFDGRGAAQNPGRWNGPGVAVVYTAESRSLASLEVLVHTEDTRVLSDVKWATIRVGIDEKLIEIPDSLPTNWRQLPAPQATRDLGSPWISESRSAVLRVPSIVVDGNSTMFSIRDIPNSSSSRSAKPCPTHSIRV